MDYLSLIIIIVGAVVFYFLGRRSIRIIPTSSSSGNIILVDTSALIDGRILEVAKTDFLFGKLIIPSYILSELQNIADSQDPLRRAKGRRGLRVLKGLQKIPSVEVEIVEEKIENVSEIDQKLVQKAKEISAKILTTDYNLNEVAKIQDVIILNINELSNAIKPILLPGEQTEVKVVQKGKEEGQGVGYLEDGTMIVVEGGARFLGRKVQCEVSRIFQTDAGRMIFVKPKALKNQHRFVPKMSIFRRPQFFTKRNPSSDYKRRDRQNF